MKAALLFFFTVTVSLTAFPQFTCGTDAYRERLIEQHPELLLQEQQNNELLYRYLVSGQQEKSTYTIPIVFHIMHNNGPENVSDATIIQAVDELNLRFQNAGPYTHATGHDADIQFCLASVDPFGNPTTGITHDQTAYTIMDNLNGSDIAMKNINRWNPATYLNVWIVNDIVGSNVAGYSSFAQANNQAYDGIVIEYSWLVNSHVLTHEVGHSFNLIHTFHGSGCQNQNCMLDGDRVCDTPPDNTSFQECMFNSCSTDLADTTGMSPFIADVPELPNYMDYTACAYSFSQGQVDRMQATLTQLRPTLLLSNGCGGNPGMPATIASFLIDSSYCTGTLRFTSTSTNALYTIWDFENDGTWDEVGADVFHTFPVTGFYTVKMLVSGYGGSAILTQTIYVRVPPNQLYPIDGFTNVHDDPFLSEEVSCPGVMATFSGVPGMTSYQWSNGETTEDISFVVDEPFSITLTAVDANGFPWTSCRTFEPIISPQLHIASNHGDTDSILCGEYLLLSLEPGAWYNVPNTTWFYDGDTIPNNNYHVHAAYSTWTLGPHEYWMHNTDINGCYVESDTFAFTVTDLPVPTLTQQGNKLVLSRSCLGYSWYKDGVLLINGPYNDSVLVLTELGCYYVMCWDCGIDTLEEICVTSLDVGLEETANGAITVAPNPFSGVTTVVFAEEQSSTTITVIDPQGKTLRTQLITSGTLAEIDLSDHAKGIYFVEIRDVLNRKTHLKILSQ